MLQRSVCGLDGKPDALAAPVVLAAAIKLHHKATVLQQILQSSQKSCASVHPSLYPLIFAASISNQVGPAASRAL